MGAGRRSRWLLAALALAPAAGCNWNEFDDTLARAPVLSVGPGDDYKARDVGKVVLPLAVPAGKKDRVAARYLVAGTETPSLAVVDLDASGHARTHVASAAEIMDMAGEAKAAVKSAVELADGRVLLGTPSYNLTPLMVPAGRIYFLKLDDTGDDVAFTLTRGNDPSAAGVVRQSHGLALAAGSVGGGPAQDLVIASQTDVTMAPDGNDAAASLVASKPTCPVNLDETAQEKYRFRALGVGDLIEGGGEEIAVGVPREGTMPGKVVILVPGEGGLDCPITIAAPAAQPRFGNALLVSDVNGDGKKDLLVGAPPLRAYLYLGPFAAGSAPTPSKEFKHPTLMDSQALGDFGFRVGAVDVDGLPGPEVLVSAPDLPAGGELGAGVVFAYKPDATLVAEINDNSPSANASFGFSVQGIHFAPPAGCGSDRPVLLIGADREVFTFFRLPGGPADPRCFK
jgi:hypothetical protein